MGPGISGKPGWLAWLRGVLLSLLVVGTPLVFLPGQPAVLDQDLLQLAKFSFAGVLITLLLVLTALEWIWRGRRPGQLSRFGPPLSGLMLVLLGGTASTPNPALSLNTLPIVALFLVFLWMLPDMFRRRRQVDFLFFWLLVAGMLAAGHGLLQYYGKDLFFVPVKDEYTQRWLAHGFLGNSALFAGFSAGVIPLAVYCILHGRFGVVRIFGVLGFLAMLTAVLCTQTRSVFLGLTLALMLFGVLLVWRNRPYTRQQLPLLVSLFLGLSFILLPFLQKNPQLPRTVANPSAVVSRTASHLNFWRIGAEILRQSPPWGQGLGSLSLRYPYEASRLSRDLSQREHIPLLFQDTHNEYLLIAVETGFLGLLCCAWLLCGSAVAAWRRLGPGSPPQERTLAIACLSGMTVLLVQSAFTFTFHSVPHILLLAVLAAVPAGSWCDREPSATPSPRIPA